MKKYLIITLCLFAFYRCNSNENKSQKLSEVPSDKKAEIIEGKPIDHLKALFKHFVQNYSANPSDILKKYGKPERILVDSITNIHTKGVDSVYSYCYPNTIVKIYKVIEEEKFILMEATQLNDKIDLSNCSIRINDTIDRVKLLFGTPTEIKKRNEELIFIYENAFPIYDDDEVGYIDQILFVIKENKLKEISFSPFID